MRARRWRFLVPFRLDLPDGKGGVDIKVDGSTKPDGSTAGGTTTTIGGMMHADGSVEAETVRADNGTFEMVARTDGTGITSVPLPADESLADVARNALTPPAQACKRALSPGTFNAASDGAGGTLIFPYVDWGYPSGKGLRGE